MKKNVFSENKDKLVGVLVSIFFIVLICKNLDYQRLLETFKTFNYKSLLLFVPLYVLSIFLRGVRWKYLLCSAESFKIKEAFGIFTAGNALNSYLPARAGDFWRAYHVGNLLDISKVRVLGSIILERIIDGISVLLILAFAVVFYCKQQWVVNIAYIAAGLFLGTLSVFFLAVKYNKTNEIFDFICNIKLLCAFRPFFRKTAEFINSFLDGFEALNNIKCLSFAFISSCVAWWLECIVTYMLICGFGFHFGISVAMFVISFLALSTIIPSSSIFVGPYQYAYILALSIYGIEKSNALGIAFIHQVSIMLIITIISVIYFALNKTALSDIKKNYKNTKNLVKDDLGYV